MSPVRVLVVDDSAIVRKILSERLGEEAGIEVVGTAPDVFIARDKIIKLEPDVLTLDIEMPRMDGISFLRKLMKYHPMPVIVVSSLTQRGSHKVLEALEAGAVDVLGKPGGPYSVEDVQTELAEKVKAAAGASVRKRPETTSPAPPSRPRVAVPGAPSTGSSTRTWVREVVAIGASTGGTEAIREVLQGLPADLPPMVVVQHMPPAFTGAFAERLNSICALRVKEAQQGDRLERGLALIAPGDYHMLLRRVGGGLVVELKQGPKVFHQRPSVDVLFESVAQVCGSNAVGLILTGMGKDGAAGLLRMREAGAATLAQDKASSVVYGMPAEAARIGAVQRELPLESMAGGVLDALSGVAAR